ncbi:MAG: class I SAM-dependent methyltransferase [Anaerolineae bacterium]|nr:class I SAM-dependent methyltransferase [Anaerolineae bacterium]
MVAIIKIPRKIARTIRKKWRFYRFAWQNPTIASFIKKVKNENLTYLTTDALIDLGEVTLQIEASGLEGIIVEAGCALGGSAVILAKSKHSGRNFSVYDVFDMIPPPSENDGVDVQQRYQTIKLGDAKGIGQDLYYGYETDLYNKVVDTFDDFELNVVKHNVHLVKGLYQDTLWIDKPVALAHIDCDWYESVLLCLSRIEPYLVKGGTMVIDDYYHWSGCRDAVDNYFKDKNGYEFIKKSRLHIVKK